MTNDPERGGLSRVRLTEQLGLVAGGMTMAVIEWTEEELDKLVESVQEKYGVSLLGSQERVRFLVRDFATALAEAALVHPSKILGPNDRGNR